MRLKSARLLVLLVFWPLTAATQVSQDDVRFVVLGKTANYRQTPPADQQLLNYHFFAEIFLKDQGKVSNAALITPGGHAELVFDGEGSVLEVHGGRYTSEAKLNQAFPDGSYIFSYRLANGTLLNQNVRINNSSGATRIPDPVTIRLAQEGRAVMPDAIDPGLDLLVSWSPFASGNADANGIVDDLIFVVSGDCHGNKIDHSGGPFGEEEYLTFAARDYLLKAEKLHPGEAMQLFVEHAEMDTSRYREIPEIATYATTTFLDIRTTGVAEDGRDKCPAIMPAMDGGQTDRPGKVKRGKP